MKIEAITSFSGNNFSATKGQVIDLPQSVALDLVRAKYARLTGEAAKAYAPEPEAAPEPETAKPKAKRARKTK